MSKWIERYELNQEMIGYLAEHPESPIRQIFNIREVARSIRDVIGLSQMELWPEQKLLTT